MAKSETGTGGITEDQLVELLASMRVEPAAEADYEGRFLSDLRERIARDAVCRPARTLLWEHIRQFFANVGLRKWVWGSAMCGGAALLAVCALMPGAEVAPLAAASVKAPAVVQPSVAERSSFYLAPPALSDRFTCISVNGEKAEPFTQSPRALNGTVRIFKTDAVVVYELDSSEFPSPAAIFAASSGEPFMPVSSEEDK